MTGADGTPETLPAQSVTASFFDVLGVQPIAGRRRRCRTSLARGAGRSGGGV